jgi:hypothetical protein
MIPYYDNNHIKMIAYTPKTAYLIKIDKQQTTYCYRYGESYPIMAAVSSNQYWTISSYLKWFDTAFWFNQTEASDQMITFESTKYLRSVVLEEIIDFVVAATGLFLKFNSSKPWRESRIFLLDENGEEYLLTWKNSN